jgi:hypothetical protein
MTEFVENHAVGIVRTSACRGTLAVALICATAGTAVAQWLS